MTGSEHGRYLRKDAVKSQRLSQGAIPLDQILKIKLLEMRSNWTIMSLTGYYYLIAVLIVILLASEFFARFVVLCHNYIDMHK